MALAILKGSPGKTCDVVVDCVPFFVGRCKTANLIVPHVNISRNHCQILFEESAWVVKDSSSSGTYINGCLIGKENQKVVKTGDLVRLGYSDFDLSWTFYSLKDVYSYPRPNESEGTTVNVEPGVSRRQLELANDKQYYGSGEFLLPGLEGKNNPCIVSLNNGYTLNYYSNKEGIIGMLDSHVQGAKIPFGCLNGVDINVDKKDTAFEQQQQHSLLTGGSGTTKLDLVEEQVVMASTEGSASELHTSTTVLKGGLQHLRGDESLIDVTLADYDNSSGPKTTAVDLNSLPNKEKLVREPVEMESASLGIESKLTELTPSKNSKEADNSKLQVVQNFTEIMENELQCTICSELFVDSITLGCSHSFCQFCLNQWKKKQKTCPICRKNITVETKSLVIDNYIEKMIEQLTSEVKERRLILINERKQPPSPHKKTKNKRKSSKFR